jgi:hypothetical protein
MRGKVVDLSSVHPEERVARMEAKEEKPRPRHYGWRGEPCAVISGTVGFTTRAFYEKLYEIRNPEKFKKK